VTDTVDKVIIQSETRGVQQTTNEVQGLSKAMDGVTVASQNVEKSTGSVDTKFASLERRFSTTAGQAAQLEKIQRTVNQAVAQNPELQSRANAVLEVATARFGAVATAEKALAEAHSSLSGQGQALFHSIRSIGEQLALGIPPTQALTGQLNHLTFAATGQGGISGAFSEVAGTFGRMLTPARILAGGVAGLAAGALYLGKSWQDAASEVDHALTGIGARSGTTAADIATFTKANSSAAGLSVSEARNAALELTKTGDVTISSLKGVGEAIRGYSVLTGKDASGATKTFADALGGDMLKNILAIDQRYNSLNSKSIEYIRTLIDQGDKTKALQTYIDGIAPSNKRAEESIGSLSRAWQGLKNIASNIANGPAPTPLQDQIASLQAQRDKAASTKAVGVTPGGYLNTAAAFGGKSQELAELDRQIEALQNRLNDLNAESATAQLDDLSKKAFDATNAILPQIDAMRSLDEAIRNIQNAQAKGVAPSSSGAALSVLERQKSIQQESLNLTVRQAQAIQVLQQAWGGVSGQTAMALQSLQGQLNVASQLTGAGQMKAQAEATYVQLLQQGVAADEAALIEAKQLELSKENATANVLKQVDALKDQDAMIKANLAGTEATVGAAIAYKNAIAAGADETAAAALQAATLKNSLLQAASSAGSFARSASSGASALGLTREGSDEDLIKNIADHEALLKSQAGTFGWNPGGFFQGPLAIDNSSRQQGTAQGISDAVNKALAGGGGIDAAISALKNTKGAPALMGGGLFGTVAPVDVDYSALFSQADALYSIKNGMTTNKSVQAANLRDELAFVQSTPETVARDQKILDLTSAINNLTNSTDDLNSTNQELLSPYYNEDPRTSHIGFRSQGMASGGWVDVPGSPSANDNMLAMVPVASGERISVDPMPGRRGVASGGSSTINISMPITINGNASKDEVGRTMFQASQTLVRQLAAMSR
jgi:hypothetical protein